MPETTAETLSSPTIESSRTLDTITRAAKAGAADAQEMANRVWASTSLFLSRFMYTTSYTISYGVVFPATLIARSIPHENAAVRGLMDGAKAASDKAHQVKGSGLHLPSSLTAH